MKWFRHYSDTSIVNEVLDKIEEELGLFGYARFFKVMETIVASMETKDDIPEITLSKRKWSHILGGNAKSREKFFKTLEKVSKSSVRVSDKYLTINMPWLPELLDKNASSSKIRQESSEPRIDKNRIEDNRLDKDKKRLNKKRAKITKDTPFNEIDSQNDTDDEYFDF